MTAQTRGSGHDWDDARKAALFARIVGLELSIEEAAKLHGLRVDVIQEWLRLFRRSALLAFDERLKKTLIDQGANADALAAAEFTGHIEDVSIADLVQTIEIAGKDAVITVTHDGQDHKMWCSAGAIVDAESGRLTGEAAVYRILGFERGRMVADLRPEPRERTIYAATHRLLLEGMRRMDESAPLLSKLGNVEGLYRLGERSTSARVHVSTDELSILRFFDAPRRVGEILAQSQLGDFETLSALVRLVENGYLAPAELASTRPFVGSRPDAAPASEGAAPRGDAAPRSERSGAGPRSSGRAGSAPRSDSARAARAARPTQPRRESGKARAAGGRAARGARTSHAEATVREPTRVMPSAARAERDEPPRSAPTSYMPLAVSHAPQERTLTPRWVFAAMAAAVLAPASFWFGETMSNLQARRARARDAQAAAAAAAPIAAPELPAPAGDEGPTFAVATRIEPTAATIWLDHHPVASGHLEIQLPKDGHTHELRAAADGYIPVTLMFADVAPPREITLERLPVPRAEPASAAETSPGAATAAAPDLVTLARAAAARAAAARAAVMASARGATAQANPAELAPRPRPAPPARARPRVSDDAPSTLPLALPEEPHVQIIDSDAPKIQVIE